LFSKQKTGHYKDHLTVLKITNTPTIPKNRLKKMIALLLVTSFALYVYHPMLSLAFWGDDVSHMSIAAKFNAFGLLFKDPAHAISQFSFTPLLGITFRIDYLLFGTNFLGYNLHSLFWFVTVGYLTYLFLEQLGIHRWSAMAGGISLMVSPAMVSVAGLYSTRHYLFGFGYALLSLMMLLKWCDTSRSGWFVAAVCFYFLALCSKEIYAPLLVVALFLAWPVKSNFNKALIGYFLVFLFYLLLRWLMLGSIIGGYSRGIEWGTMFFYLIKSLPRMLQTIVWGGAAPGEISAPAVVLGVLILTGTFLLAAKSNGFKGVSCLFGLLVLSLCVVALTLYVPIIRYGKEPFYCHENRFALAFSSAIWLSFWYLSGRYLTKKMAPPIVTFLLAAVIIGPLAVYGGLATAKNWGKNRITIEQVTYLNDHAAQKMLVIGHPTWFLSYYLAMLQVGNPAALVQAQAIPGPQSQAIPEQPDQRKQVHPEEFSFTVLMQPEKTILTSDDPKQIQTWLTGFAVEFDRLFSVKALMNRQ
jgi:hypothetical protein